MIRERASLFFPLIYLTLVAVSVMTTVAAPSSFIGFGSLFILCVPWSVLIMFFLSWAMMHDNSIFNLGIVLFVAGALINTFFVYKFGSAVQSVIRKNEPSG